MALPKPVLGKTKCSIVLGLQFGDEGKGNTTAFLTENGSKNNLLIRFSGGPQIGHHVFNGDLNARHTFKVFGSGTLSLNSGNTYLSKYVLFYPTTLLDEIKDLSILGFNKGIFVDNFCPLITPLDITFQQIKSKYNPNSSCGMGIAPTMKRTLKDFSIYASDCLYPDILKMKLNNLKEYYLKLCLEIDKSNLVYYNYNTKNILLDKCDEIYTEFLKYDLDKMIDDFINDIKILNNAGVFYVNEDEFLSKNLYEHYIFEGSQGILLDKNHGFFPDVTFSNTTSLNALSLINKLPFVEKDISIYYCLRTYLTRHGSGIPYDDKTKKFTPINNSFEINGLNDYQGEFKTYYHSFDFINYALHVDNTYSYFVKNKIISISCLDQTDDKICIDEKKMKISISYFNHCNSMLTNNSPDFKKIKLK